MLNTIVNLKNKYKSHVDSELVKYRLLEKKENNFVEPITDNEYYKFKSLQELTSIIFRCSVNNIEIPYSYFGYNRIEIIERYNTVIKSYFKLTYYDSDDILTQNIITETDVFLGDFLYDENSLFELIIFNPTVLKRNSEVFYIYAPKYISNIYLSVDFYCAKNGIIYNLYFDGLKYINFTLNNFKYSINGFNNIINNNILINADLR